MLACSPVRTRKVPRIEATIPIDITRSGSTSGSESKSRSPPAVRIPEPSKTGFSPTLAEPSTATAASVIVATIEPE